MKKFKLTGETKEVFGIKLYRIEATDDFGNVSKGDLGGWVEKESNLSQDGNAWVSGDAWVYGDARVYGDASVSGDAWVYGNASVSGDAWVYGDARVYGKELIGGYFYHTKEKSEKVEIMENDDDYETLCLEPEYADKDNEETINIEGQEYSVKEIKDLLKERMEK